MDYASGLFRMMARPTEPGIAPCAALGAVYRLKDTPADASEKKLAELRCALALEAFLGGSIPDADVSWGWDRRTREGVPMILVEPLGEAQHPLKGGGAVAELRARAAVRVPLDSPEGKKLAEQLEEDTKRRRKLMLSRE